ncbi:hypothetical protein E05_39750 [Plautia stali symbiont]|nr:hypothetical protein E05_39750 [Plautia stali symbiont]
MLQRKNRSQNSHVRIWILCLILFLSVVAYADRSCRSPARRSNSAFSWAYVIGQIPRGLILDRFGTKKVYGVTLALWSISTLLMGFLGEFSSGMTMALTLMFALRFALGLIEAPSFPANARAVIMWFPGAERGRASSLFALAQYFAVAIFSPLSGWLVSRYGWEWPFFVLGGIGVLAVFVWAGYMRSPRQHPHVSASELHYIEQGGALVDMTLVGGLLVMVMLSGYENFVSKLDIDESKDKLSWLGKMDSGSLKNKVAASIVAISSIHLLRILWTRVTSPMKS